MAYALVQYVLIQPKLIWSFNFWIQFYGALQLRLTHPMHQLQVIKSLESLYGLAWNDAMCAASNDLIIGL